MKVRILGVMVLLILVLCPFVVHADNIQYGEKTYDPGATYIDLGDYVVSDFASFVSFLDQMPHLTHVDMWANEMTAEQCDMLAARYPDIRWGWTMVISAHDHKHLVRTDFTSWSTLHNNQSAQHSSKDFSVLKYCWNLLALDVGHNNVTSLDFLYDLPNLRVLIVACNQITDITPIASLKNLEYAELFNNKITDITPLIGLSHLMDLNLCFNKIPDLTPLQNLTSLKRLWIYSSYRINTVPAKDVVDFLNAALPNTLIDSTHYSTAGTWRYLNETAKDPHYATIVAMFGEDHLHPKTAYVPFHDSWPMEESPILSPGQQEEKEQTTQVTLDDAPPLTLLEPQDFSDKGYLLPIDFNPGKAPDEAGYLNNTYQDSTITVTVKEGNTGTCAYWYADIVLKDPSQLRTMAASLTGAFDVAGEMDPLMLAYSSDAVVAINGDFWNSSEKHGLGFVVRQGILYNDNLDTVWKQNVGMMDVLLIDEDGDFIPLHTPSAGTIKSRVNGKRILNSFSFGPILVENGVALRYFRKADQWMDMAPERSRQRMCICQVDHLHYMVVCCAGPYGGNTAMTLPEFAELVASLGVQTAYNLDGGDSTLLYFHGNRVNMFGSTSQRKLMDIIYFASAK